MGSKLKFVPGLVGACIMGMMQVGPNDAVLNFCKWVRLAGLTNEASCVELPHLVGLLWAFAALFIGLTVVLLAKSWWSRRRMPLTDAARQLYETARHTEPGSWYAAMADHKPDSEDDVLRWFAYQLQHRAVLYGEKPPSQRLEKVQDMDRFSFEVENGQVIAKEKMGVPRWINLQVRRSDLRKARRALGEGAIAAAI
jgi:hypothetical protein